MMFDGLIRGRALWISTFNAVLDRFESVRLSFTEADALRASHWDQGEDARLREDLRFRPTPWGRWILTHQVLANETLRQRFLEEARSFLSLEEALRDLDQATGWYHVFCPADRRFVLRGDDLRLAASELSDRPLLEDPDGSAKFTTHLPLHTLQAAAASEPLGEWGPEAHEQVIETLGWIRVQLADRRLNDRMFVARIRGQSMDNGRNGLRDGAYAVFELWPESPRDDLIALVRGALRDPETGSYAIKKLRLGPRGEDGRLSGLRLVSLNSDKARYPDIELSSTDESQVRIVATLVQPLSGDAFVRRPRRPPTPGQRDLRSEEGLEAQSERLRNALTRLFEETGMPAAAAQEQRQRWESRLELLDHEAGGLRLVTTPLAGLPNFVKKLELRSGEFSRIELSTNLRTKTWRVQIPPLPTAYEWSAPGFEDDQEISSDLARLRLEGLSTARVTVFRVGADGTGRSQSGSSLTPGQRYRLLIPSGLDAPSVAHDASLSGLNVSPPGEAVSPPGPSASSPGNDAAMSGNAGSSRARGECWLLAGGWQVWELDLPSPVPFALRSQLERLGLSAGEAGLSVSWSGAPPREYRETRTGERYPCFHPQDQPAVVIRGVRTASSGEIYACVGGAKGMMTLSLSAGEHWILGLEDFDPGCYVLELVPLRTRFERVQLPFEIDPTAGILQQARVTVTVGDDRLTLEGVVSLERNLSLLGRVEMSLRMSAPPLWPIRAHWTGGQTFPMGPFHAGVDGAVDLASLLEQTRSQREEEALGELRLEAGELGILNLRHRMRMDEETLRRRLGALLEERGTIPDQASGDFLLLRQLWLEPVCRLLGLSLRPLPEDVLTDLPSGSAAWFLVKRQWGDTGISASTVGVLVAARRGVKLKEHGPATPRDVAGRLCNLLSLSWAFITDGLIWTHFVFANAYMSRSIDLSKLINEGDPELMEDFQYWFVKE